MRRSTYAFFLVLNALLLFRVISATTEQPKVYAAAENATSNPSLLPSKCPGACTTYGTCNEELGRCDCPLGNSGLDCSETVTDEKQLTALCARYGHALASCTKVEPSLCINACNFRGRCIAGFCHCRPGSFGADCSLSLPLLHTSNGQVTASSPISTADTPVLLAGLNYSVRASGPRIYIYELPPQLTVWQNMDRVDRPLTYLIWQRLLSAGVRVSDPRVADFFFVPVRARMPYDCDRVREAVQYVRATWPYWNATGGGRHLFVHTSDWGRDDLTPEVQLLTRNATWLTHWGLARDHNLAEWKAAHRPGRDIVLPLMLQHSLLAGYRLMRLSPLHPAGPQRKRGRTLFFAGRVCGSRAPPRTNGSYPPCPDVVGKEDAYSASTRQRAFFYHHNRTNWKVVTSSRTFASDMLTSNFCLAPTGAGAGKRAVLAPLMGCVPVTLTDGLMQPFEPEMRWDRFAIDVRERDIPIMHEVLESLSQAQVDEFRANLHCAAQHLFWSSLYGSLFGEDGRYDAFETLVQILRMRATYPSVGPEEYAYVDPAFAAFMNCQAPPAAGDSGGSGTGAEGKDDAVLGVAKPALQHALSAGGGQERGNGVPAAPRLLAAQEAGRMALCTLSQLPTEGGWSCNACAKRRGRLFNPGGTICCNAKDLTQCPRLWD